MTQISLTVPSDDELALVAAGTFFLTLAGKVPALELDDAPEAEATPDATMAKEDNWDRYPNTCCAERDNVLLPGNLPDEFLKLNDADEWVDPTAESKAVEAAEAKLKGLMSAPPPPVQETTVESEAGDTTPSELPWDSRIHSSSKAKNKDGTWRYKRGVDKDVVATVEAELKGLLSTPVAPPPPPAQETTAPPPPVQETTAPPPPAQGMTVPAFLQLVTANIVAKKWTREEIEQAIVNQGVPGVDKIPHLMAHKDLIPKVLEELNA